MNTVTENITAATEAILSLVAMVIAMAFSLFAMTWGGRWLLRTFRSFAEEPYSETAEEKFDFNAAGLGKGWNEHRDWGGSVPNTGHKGSGLHRGKR